MHTSRPENATYKARVYVYVNVYVPEEQIARLLPVMRVVLTGQCVNVTRSGLAICKDSLSRSANMTRQSAFVPYIMMQISPRRQDHKGGRLDDKLSHTRSMFSCS